MDTHDNPGTYNDPADRPHTGRTGAYPAGTGRTGDINAAVAYTPTDRVRWGPILAGLFAALATLALLSVLGAAIGATAFDANDSLSAFGIGAGIWGIISALLAFLVGGWLAARSAAVRGHGNGMLNGTMVWAVAIPLMLYFVSGGLTSLLGTTAGIAGDAAGAATSGAAQVADDGLEDPLDRAQTAAGRVGEQVPQVTGQDVRSGTAEAADAVDSGLWWTLLALLLSLGAAAAGGFIGARKTYHDHDGDRDRHTAGRPATA
ncbi:MAG: hypothetical protein ACFCVE_16330 [Phycisphaerae bacterium]